MKAIGLIETKGIVGAIEAADVALKTAQVEIISLQKVKAGLITIIFEGDVGAVKASVEAGAAAAERMGVLLASHMIARPDDSVENILERKKIETVEDKITEVNSNRKEEVSNMEEIEEEIQEINEILKVNKNKKNKK